MMYGIRKLSLARLAAYALAATIIPTLANAAASGNVTLTGSVAANCQITVTAEAAAATLDLATDQTNLKVATVNEKCNDPDGYTVDLVSTWGAGDAGTSVELESATTSERLVYTVRYDTSAVTFDASGSAQVTDVLAKTGGSGVDKDIDISYSGSAANLAAGTDYTDTLTVTITAK